MLDQALFSFWRSSARVSTKRGKGGLPIIDLLPKPPESDEKLCYMKFQVTDREKQHILSLVPQWAQFKGARESDDAIALRCLTRGLRANREPPQWFHPLRSPQLALPAANSTDAEDYAGIIAKYSDDLDVRLRREKDKSVAHKKVSVPSFCDRCLVCCLCADRRLCRFTEDVGLRKEGRASGDGVSCRCAFAKSCVSPCGCSESTEALDRFGQNDCE
jgi:hypothetical protein